MTSAKLKGLIVQYEITELSPCYQLLFIENREAQEYYYVQVFEGKIIEVHHGTEMDMRERLEQMEKKIKSDGWRAVKNYIEDFTVPCDEDYVYPDTEQFLKIALWSNDQIETLLGIFRHRHTFKMQTLKQINESHYTSWGEWA